MAAIEKGPASSATLTTGEVDARDPRSGVAPNFFDQIPDNLATGREQNVLPRCAKAQPFWQFRDACEDWCN